MRHVGVAVSVDQALLLAVDLVLAIADLNAVAVGILRIGQKYFGRFGHIGVMTEAERELAADAM